MLRYQLFKIKEGKLPVLKAWFAELKMREEEVREALREENVLSEYFVLLPGDYVLGLQEHLENRISADLSKDLNKKHLSVLKECLEHVNTEEILKFCQR